jgi:oligopeptide transport system permease protein
MAGYFSKEQFKEMSELERTNYLRNIGVLDPALVQLKNFVVKILHGDLGRSVTVYPKAAIKDILGDKIKYSALLNVLSMVVVYVFGLSLGILMARYKGKWPDQLGTAYVIIMRSVPSIIILFFVQFYLSKLFRLPMMFYANKPLSWILPVVSLSLGSIAGTGIWLRRYLVDEENKDYIKFAQAKGLSHNYIMVRHIFRNAIVPIAINFPSEILLLISGGLVTESLYSVPGMGGLLITSIRSLDNPLVQDLVLIFAVLSVAGVFLGDIFVSFVDPRIKLKADKE